MTGGASVPEPARRGSSSKAARISTHR